MVYGSVYPSPQEEAISAAERTGLQPFSLPYGNGEEISWIGSYSLAKGGTKAAQYKQPFYGEEEAARNLERVREVKRMFKLANLERRKHLADLEEEDLERMTTMRYQSTKV
ncbi:unnamed protein product [Cylicocyclus nassatus]|uniref:Uncharacterized protein n=1 Tax=Cylicocyclus nassatus TaxID=53992 RepID=A0AA36M5M1_CYLNA|nr:unnamed protein product [Cylicocyclus nassatus]